MAIMLVVSVVFLVFLAGMLLAFLFTGLDRTVTTTQANMAAEERAYNPGMTLGHRVKPGADYEEQLKQARLEAAKKAAATPRGANSQIGRDGKSTLATAGKSADIDAMTAVRVARFHGWDGVRTGAPSVNALAAAGTAPAVATVAAPAVPPPTLIAITDSMSPEEVRKARIANAKAESAYNKALKAASSGAPVAVAGAAPAAAAQAAAPMAAAPAVSHIEKPKLIEITPDMAPEDVRKARVANAKAEAAYNKALKAAGATPGAVQPAVAAAAPAAPQPAPAASAAPAPALAGIQPPQLIEITDSMAPEEIRRARVANAKAESAYNKALKAAGIDPAAVKAGAATVAAAPAAPVQPVVAEAPAAAAPAPAPPAPAGGSQIPAGIERPKLVEITADMSPEDVRRARVENAKAQSAFNKALKAAGIDPASVK